MTKSSSKTSSSGKTQSSSRRLPLRSSSKRARLAEPIAVDDDPEPRSAPVNAVPIAQIHPRPAIQDPHSMVLQSFYNLSVAFNVLIDDLEKTIEKKKVEIEKAKKDKSDMSSIIAKLQLESKVNQTERKNLQKELQAMKIDHEKKIEETKESVRAARLRSGMRIFWEYKIKMAKEAKTVGVTVEGWDIEKWEAELKKYPSTAQPEQKSIPSEEKMNANEGAEEIEEKTKENEVPEVLADEKVEEATKEVEDMQVSDEGKDNQA